MRRVDARSPRSPGAGPRDQVILQLGAVRTGIVDGGAADLAGQPDPQSMPAQPCSAQWRPTHDERGLCAHRDRHVVVAVLDLEQAARLARQACAPRSPIPECRRRPRAGCCLRQSRSPATLRAGPSAAAAAHVVRRPARGRGSRPGPPRRIVVNIESDASRMHLQVRRPGIWTSGACAGALRGGRRRRAAGAVAASGRRGAGAAVRQSG